MQVVMSLYTFIITYTLSKYLATTSDSLSLNEMLHRMGWPARVIAICLGIMSIYSISVILERWLTFNSARNQSKRFVIKVASALRNKQIEEAISISEHHKKSHLAIVVNSG